MSLLNNVASLEKKTAYQTYTIQHGIERIKVAVPLSSAPLFEEDFKNSSDKNKSTILLLVEKYKGKVKG